MVLTSADAFNCWSLNNICQLIWFSCGGIGVPGPLFVFHRWASWQAMVVAMTYVYGPFLSLGDYARYYKPARVIDR